MTNLGSPGEIRLTPRPAPAGNRHYDGDDLHDGEELFRDGFVDAGRLVMGLVAGEEIQPGDDPRRIDRGL